jgi:formylglycine-generating enzyme
MTGTPPGKFAPSQPPAADMVWVPRGGFLMGSRDFYLEGRPVRRIEVDGFWTDDHPVTVAAFPRFVAATGYVTVAEPPLYPAQYQGADSALQEPGSLVFHKTDGPVDLRDVTQWWRCVSGGQWRHPRGRAAASSGWKSTRSLTSAPRTSRPRRLGRQAAPQQGGVGVRRPRQPRRPRISPGERFAPGGTMTANTWEGFTWQNLVTDDEWRP